MKKIFRMLVGVAVLAALASCDHSAQFKTNSFARMSSGAYSVKENVGILRVPVSVFNNEGATTAVTFKVTDVSAVEGVNYTVEPASGVLNFTGNSTEFITFTIINQAGIYTGNVKFVVDLLSATNNVEVCALTRATVTIEDIDHPLAAILGQYTASCYDLDSGDIDYTITLSPDEKDVSLVWVDYIVPMFSDYKTYGDGSIYGKVSADLNTITFPVGQTTSFNVGYGNMQVLGCYYDDGYYTVKEDIVFTRQEDGSFVTDSGICCVDQYVWPGYGGFILGKVNGKQTVWTPAK